MKNTLPAITATLAITAMAASAAPRLIVSTPSLTPESQIDLVLDSAAAPPGDLGKTVENTWLEIQPALPGKLRWKAPEIAQFIPDQPPAIGTTYSFSIAKGREHLDHTTVPAGEFAKVSSEAFRIVAANSPNRWSSSYSPSIGAWTVVFNDVVDPATVGNFISFSNKSSRVSAKVERTTVEKAGYHAYSSKPWAARFPGAPEIDRNKDSIVPNVLVVSPASPLPPGEGWNLTFLPGLPNQGGTAKTVDNSVYGIGKIEPFQVTGINPLVTPDEPRKIVIAFNQPVPESLPVDFLTKCVDINPRPENLSATLEDKEIILTGNLDDADNYSVTFRKPFVSRGGLDLANTLDKNVVFERLDPELILPSGNEAQLANGSRSYRIHTVNLSNLHIRIKRPTGTDLIRAFQGYRNYSGTGHNGEAVEPTAPLPYALVGGQTILEKDIPLDNRVDTSKEVVLSWDELLPKEARNATFFLDITGTPHKGSGKEGRRNVQALVQLTDIGLVWKSTGKEAMLYAFSCNTGAPLPGVKLQTYGEDAAPLATITTDAAGLARVPRTDDVRHLQASLGDDSYLTAFDETLQMVGLWHFPIRYSYYGGTGPVRKAFLFTDRSLYRPGETVRLKGIVRNQDGNAIVTAKPGKARVIILDPTEKEIHSSDVTISAGGSFDLSYTLPDGKTGTHLIRLEYPEEIALAEPGEGEDSEESDMNWRERETLLQSARFELPLQVEEFRRNAFEVKQAITPAAPGATSLSTELSASYYQGQPVAAGKVKTYSRIVAENPYPERFRDFLFGNHRVDDWTYWYHYFGYRWDDDGQEDRQATQAEGETQLSAEGKVTLATQIPQAEFPTAREVTISSEVTDANNQTLTSTATTTVHPASVYVGISRVDSLVRAGDKLPLKIVATDTEGEPFKGAIKVTATLSRQVNDPVKSRMDSGATTTRNDTREETVITSEVALDPAASAGEGTTFTVSPQATGLHFLTVRGTDPEGRAFATVIRFHVYGTKEYPWLYEDGLRVKLVADKKSYKPGETAKVLVLSPIEGTALVTLEREKVLRSFQVELKADNPVIEIPVEDGDAPNAYVSVLIVKGAKESAREHKEPQLRLGYCELIVENRRDLLSVSFEPVAESYRPGEEVTIGGTITLADGKPAAGAEVTFYAEDEGTLAVMGYETPSPMQAFYRPRTLDVDTGTSFETFIPEDPESQYFSNKGFFIGGGGDWSKLEDLLRKNFDPCAAWSPALVTDAYGKFTSTFKLPDTLTRYRLIAIAHEGQSRFGSAESAIIVKKDLMLEPKTPRFANQSDSFNTQVLVQNASTHKGTWEIAYSTSTVTGTPVVSATGSTRETITLDPGASTTVVFPSRADDTGEAVLTWTATPVSLATGNLTPQLTRRLSDAVETRFEVHYPMPLLRQSKMVSLNRPGEKQNLRDALDKRLLEGSGNIELGLSRSPLIEAAGSVDYLLHYPYGCVEQTTSSLVPWLAVEDLRPIFPRLAATPEEKVRKAIQAGANRLLSMQLPDGSFAYWPGDKTAVPWATSYAGLALILASERGANVPASATSALVNKLTESLRGMASEHSPTELEVHARSLLVLAIAGSPQTAYRNTLMDRIPELTPSARSLLAASIAMEDEGNAENVAAAKALLESKVPFKSKEDGWMRWIPEDSYKLLAWSLVDPTASQTQKALEEMLRARNPYGAWQTTWVNGWSLLAMASYAKHDKLGGEPVTVALGSGPGAEKITLTPDHPVVSRSFKLSPDLDLSVLADRATHVRVNIAAKPKIEPIQPVANNGLTIDRIYEKVNPDGTTTPLAQAKVGDLIRVTLRVSLPKDESRYLVIDDPLPALFETVNNDFKSQRSALEVKTSEKDWRVSHSELRTDRATFFLDYVWNRGTYTVTYLARCTISGQATAPPAKVESMYDPENFALSASRVFVVD